MKYILIFMCVTLGMGCTHPNTKDKNLQSITSYYESLNQGDIEHALKFVDDSFINIQGPDTARYTNTSYRNWLEWDQSFEPLYTIEHVEVITSDTLLLTIKKADKRITFLNHDPLVYTQYYYFVEGKLSSILLQDYKNFNYSTWSKRKNDLEKYIENNHPELEGFMIEQTKKGGEKYLSALQRYNLNY